MFSFSPTMERTNRSYWKTVLPLLFLSLFSTVGSSSLSHHHRGVSSTIRFRLGRDGGAERGVPMRAGAALKIAVFADLHFGEAESEGWGAVQDVNSVKVMNTVLDDETPDFVIYLGDVITANNIMVANASLYWDQAISPAQDRGIPWASVFGNHDDAAFEWPLEWFSAPGIPQVDCPPTGTSCSGEEGFSSSDDPQSPVAFLYFLDSGGGSYPEVISSSQAEWFQQKSKQINSDSRVAEIIFWHIPSTAYKTVAPEVGGIQKPCVGSLNKESVASQEAETGIMNLLVNRTSVKAIFVGHNHGLDWCCPYQKLWLCYARHTGYGGYGDWLRGARILEITEKPFSLKSWIRMEDGQMHSEVVLS
ncbi:hypothetical protein PIB30_031978 [Stylosanthes scabra]|uniref:Calcineurin-like phosphoesterase domain-containing protein n=1 Tax=Stylosanthes scabra TaxID=79078 RepID=A0ABU6UDZ4_9FABA|nr:hypothetical protein [Stylosanthes scabra]